MEMVILVSEVHELLIVIHYILDNAISKWARNKSPILAYLFNSASRQGHRSLDFVIPLSSPF